MGKSLVAAWRAFRRVDLFDLLAGLFQMTLFAAGLVVFATLFLSAVPLGVYMVCLAWSHLLGYLAP